MKYTEYKQNDKVMIHSLGPHYEGKTFRGIICGKSSELFGTSFYIVEMVDPIDESYGFSHCTMVEGCLRPGWRDRAKRVSKELNTAFKNLGAHELSYHEMTE